jgi:hypothetical protein
MRERLRVLRHHDFRNVWLAQSTSAVGDGVVIVALALFVTERPATRRRWASCSPPTSRR